MIYSVSPYDSKTINFAPKSVIEEVLQNVRTLLATLKYSVPLDRALGISASYVDTPTPRTMALLKIEIAEEIERSEPRTKVRVVEFKAAPNDAVAGKLYPVLEVEILESRYHAP